LALIAVSIAVIGSFLFFGLTGEKRELDKTTNCPVKGPQSYTAVIIDTTDSVNAIQKIAIRNAFSQIKSGIPRNGALAVYAAGFKGDLSRPETVLCNPGHAGEIDPLIEGQRIAEKMWREGFEKPLESVLEKMLSLGDANNTPLLEAVQSVSVQSFGPLKAAGRDDVPKKLIIFSDMLQHSDHLSLYGGVPDAKKFMKTEAYRRIRSDLRGVEVTIHLVRRETKKPIQGTTLIKFWEELINGEGGRLVHFNPLEG